MRSHRRRRHRPRRVTRASDDGAPTLVDRAWVRARVPAIAANAHKGTRRRVAIVGGAQGMAGASILAARAALRSGVGMARASSHRRASRPLQARCPRRSTRPWPESDDEIRDAICDWAHAVVIGRGSARRRDTRARVERMLRAVARARRARRRRAHAVRGRRAALGALLEGRTAIDHAARRRVLAARAESRPTTCCDAPFDAAASWRTTLGCVVLLKGVPTVLTAPTGERLVSAAGTPALATGGSGDVLAGIAGTLLAQIDDPLDAAACAAWIHGRAAEIAGAARRARNDARRRRRRARATCGASRRRADVRRYSRSFRAIGRTARDESHVSDSISLGPGREFDVIRDLVRRWGDSRARHRRRRRGARRPGRQPARREHRRDGRERALPARVAHARGDRLSRGDGGAERSRRDGARRRSRCSSR